MAAQAPTVSHLFRVSGRHDHTIQFFMAFAALVLALAFAMVAANSIASRVYYLPFSAGRGERSGAPAARTLFLRSLPERKELRFCTDVDCSELATTPVGDVVERVEASGKQHVRLTRLHEVLDDSATAARALELLERLLHLEKNKISLFSRVDPLHYMRSRAAEHPEAPQPAEDLARWSHVMSHFDTRFTAGDQGLSAGAQEARFKAPGCRGARSRAASNGGG